MSTIEIKYNIFLKGEKLATVAGASESSGDNYVW